MGRLEHPLQPSLEQMLQATLFSQANVLSPFTLRLGRRTAPNEVSESVKRTDLSDSRGGHPFCCHYC